MANVSVVPCTAVGWVVLVLGDGRPEVPGGTREPGESVMGTLRRELLEEAGATVWGVGLHFLGEGAVPAAFAASAASAAGRVGQVELVSEPTIGDGEDVVEVLTLSLEEAQGRFRAVGRGDLADLYGLAAAVAGNRRARGRGND